MITGKFLYIAGKDHPDHIDASVNCIVQASQTTHPDSFPQIKNHLKSIPWQAKHGAIINDVKQNPLAMVVVSYQWSNKCSCCRLSNNSPTRIIINTNDASDCFWITLLDITPSPWFTAVTTSDKQTFEFHRCLKIISHIKILSSENSSITLKSVIKHFFISLIYCIHVGIFCHSKRVSQLKSVSIGCGTLNYWKQTL